MDMESTSISPRTKRGDVLTSVICGENRALIVDERKRVLLFCFERDVMRQAWKLSQISRNDITARKFINVFRRRGPISEPRLIST